MKFGADFETLLARFSEDTNKPLTIAVSGGSDSLALLWNTHEWSARSGRQLQVFTVDHRLRAESASEAEHVAGLCEALGHFHMTLTWDTPKKTQSAAREARYELICKAMQASGGRVLLTGHTFDDVFETAMIRRRRGVRDASIAGPALAAPAPVWPNGRAITVIRPLIHATRSALRQFLTERDCAWIEDPSNESIQFERVRVRKFLARHPSLADLGRSFVQVQQKQRATRDASLGKHLSQVEVHADGTIEVHQSPMTARAMALLARCASGTASEPRLGAVRDMLSSLTRPGQRQTLGGAWSQKTPTGLLIGRDPGATNLKTDHELFDGRFERKPGAGLPQPAEQTFLVRHASPPDSDWREIVSDRISHLALCLQTPLLNPVES